MMTPMIGSLVSSLLALSLWAADDPDIVVLKAEELSWYHRDLAKRLADSSSATREAYVIVKVLDEESTASVAGKEGDDD
jgi:hypothetical protein